MIRPQSIRKAQVPVGPLLVHCKVHKNEEVKHFCKNCNVLVCVECIVGHHNGHQFLRLQDVAIQQRKCIQQAIDKMRSITIPNIRKTIRKAEKTHEAYSEKGTAVVNGIKDWAEEQISDINKTREAMILELERAQSPESKKLNDFKKKMEKLLSNAEELAEASSSQMRMEADAYIVNLGLELQIQIPEMEKEMALFPTMKENVFIPGEITNSSIKSLSDQCRDTEPQESQQSIDDLTPQKMDHVYESKLEVVREFQYETDKGSIKAIAAQDNKKAWIATYKGYNIKRVNQAGDVDKTLEFTTYISDIAVTNDGGLLVKPDGGFDEQGYEIKKVQPNGDIVTFVDMIPLKPNCICTSKTGHIYVGCVDVTDKSGRCVVKLSSTGIEQHRYQYDHKGQTLFTLPYKLQENTNGDVWVYDRTGTYEGRVVVIQQDGKLRFIYTGVRNDKITRPFNPGDITAAGNGTMLICDTNNDIIHVVDENGTLLCFLGSEHKTGIDVPTSISLDKKHNQLWIGNIKCQVQVLRLT